jgi:hypothetical protein
MPNKNIGVVVLIIVLAAIGYYLFKSPKEAVAPVENTTTDQSIPTTPTTPTTSSTTKPASTLKYTDAQKLYAGKILQIDPQCKATPRAMTFKNNTNIMIDNRAPVAHSVKIGSVYNIEAYGFKIVKLSSGSLPATLLVDCGSQQNVATISLQK